MSSTDERPRRPGDPGAGRAGETLKHTVNSVIVAFVLAFVFRAFVVEPFVIPTGSMAPTLLGAHVDVRAPASGYAWAVTPRDYAASAMNQPLAVQGAPSSSEGPLVVEDPMTRQDVRRESAMLRPGDRIIVQKYIYALERPRRWDVVVFRSPEQPGENFIKRLVGLPGESLRIVDGDIFIRRTGPGGEAMWRIERKPLRVQRDLWRPLYSSEYAPLDSAGASADWIGPWKGEGWRIDGTSYRCDSAAGATLAWDEGERTRSAPRWAIDDWAFYNDTPAMHDQVRRDESQRFPVSDLRVRAGVEPDGPLALSITIAARSHQFRAALRDGRAAIEMRRAGTDDAPWRELESAPVALAPGRTTEVEFWHADQSLSLWVDGARVAGADLDWPADERLQWAGGRAEGDGARYDQTNPENYQRPRVSIAATGAPVTLHRLGLDRDLAYQGSRSRQAFDLGEDEYFVLGDNSAASRDARSWERVDPWVAAEMDDRPGVVPGSLMMGKAFFVYFPAPVRSLGRLPIPDFGRMRFIR